MRTWRLMLSTMWTGMRMVPAWSAIVRLMACRIHQVAVRAELEAQVMVKLLNCPQQTDVTLLDQIAEAHATAHVALRYTDDKP